MYNIIARLAIYYSLNVTQVGHPEKVSFQFKFEIVQRRPCRVAQMHLECIPGSRRSEIKSVRTYRLGFRPENLQLATVQVSQMISDERTVHRGGRAEIEQVVRRVRVCACIQTYTQFEFDAV